MVTPDTSFPTAEKVENLENFRLPSRLSLATAADFVARAGPHATPLRKTFIRGERHDAPPLSLMLKGGGGTRLKLFLSILLMCRGYDIHDTDIAANKWAELLDLPNPRSKGARRISDALEWLELKKFVALERRRGAPHVITILKEDGSGDPYVRPGGNNEYYVGLPIKLWSNGWIAVLSPPAVASLLILMDQKWMSDSPNPVWLSQTLRAGLYGVSEDTLYRGMTELDRWTIITKDLRWHGGPLQVRRRRNMYTLNLGHLELAPETVARAVTTPFN